MKTELQDLINDCTSEILDIESRIQILPPLDKEIRFLTNYVLIKAAGTAEFVYKSIVADYFSTLSNHRIDTYFDSKVRNGQMSATYENMCNLLKQFDETWCKAFKKIVCAEPDGQKMIDASNSLVSNRHCFAHGKNPSATLMEIKQYYMDVVKMIGIFDTIVNAN